MTATILNFVRIIDLGTSSTKWIASVAIKKLFAARRMLLEAMK
jgi:hypothetical protein